MSVAGREPRRTHPGLNVHREKARTARISAPPGERDHAAMSGRPPPPPRVDSDNFAAVSDAQVVWDDRTASLGLQDVRYAVAAEGIAKITISRPRVHNSFRPITVDELSRTLAIARNDVKVGVIILTGDGPNAFCAGGDQAVRGDGGYDDGSEAAPRLQILDFQVQMRRCPKPIIAMVAGYAVGGGHILHMVADLTIAADNAVFGQDSLVRRRPWQCPSSAPAPPQGALANSVRLGTPTGRVRATGSPGAQPQPRAPRARRLVSHLHPPPPSFGRVGQTGPRVGSFDGGYGSAHMARIVGQKKARELPLLCRLCIQPAALFAGCSPLVSRLQPCAQPACAQPAALCAHAAAPRISRRARSGSSASSTARTRRWRWASSMPSRCSTLIDQARPWQRHYAQGGPPTARATPSHMRRAALRASKHGVRVGGLSSTPAKAPVAPARESLQGCACVRGYRVAGGHPPGASRASGAGDAAVVAPHGQSCPPGSGRASHRRLQRPTACSELPSGPERRGLAACVPR